MTLPSEMNCVVLDGFGGPEVLKPGKRPMPTIGADEVLIKVAAAGGGFQARRSRLMIGLKRRSAVPWPRPCPPTSLGK